VQDRDDGPRPRSRGVLIAAAIEAFAGLIAGAVAPSTIDNFNEVFKGFGADLPALTGFFVATSRGWWTFTIAGIAMLAWIIQRPETTALEQRRQKLAVIAFASVFGIVCALAFYSLYLPIFKLGSVV